MVEKHGVFQGYYFSHHLGLDRDMRNQFQGHPYYQRTRLFWERYDNPAFDPIWNRCRSQPSNPWSVGSLLSRSVRFI